MITSTPLSSTSPKELSEKDFKTKKDRRSGARRDAHWPVQVKTRQKQIIEGFTVNVATSGLLLSIAANLKPKDVVFVECISTYKGKRRFLQAICEVKWNIVDSGGFRTAVTINSATELTKNFLKEYSGNKI